MADFELLPAIDVRSGQVVRLEQGDFSRETTFADDPAAVASAFADAGARWLHVVDLDGARAGKPIQQAVLGRILAAVGSRLAVEVSGGLRTAEAVAGVLDAGATRVAVGTAALRDPAFAAGLVRTHGADRVVGSIDVRDGAALGDAWGAGSAVLDAGVAVHRLADAGITTFEVTAIDRDGLLGGPDLDLLARLVALGRGRIIASGGVSSGDDLRNVQTLGCSGAIVGRALYEGRLTIGDALAAVGAVG